MAALPQAPDLERTPWTAPSKNFAVEQGMHPLQNWIFSTLAYWPLALDAYPCRAVGIEADWGEGLDKFAVLSSGADAASREQTAQELVLQLQGLAEGSGRPAALLVWSYFIQGIDKHLAEGADLPRLLQLLCGFLSGDISPLFQDAAAYCGCAMLEHWAVHQQPPCRGAGPAVSKFLCAVGDLVEALGREGLHLLKERTECPDPSCHPGCRATALAYSNHAAATRLHNCPAFSVESRQHGMLLGALTAGCALAPLFEAPSGELLSTWQVYSLPRLLPVFATPALYAKNMAAGCKGVSLQEFSSHMEILASCNLMQRYLEAVAKLTGPLKVAVLEPLREGAAFQAEQISSFLSMTTDIVRLLVGVGVELGRFLECGGIPTLLNYLSAYAELQQSLQWQHPAHGVAEDALEALLDWQRQYKGAHQVLLECGAAATLVAVVDSAPSISEAASHIPGVTTGAKHAKGTPSQASVLRRDLSAQAHPSIPAMAAGTGQQPQLAQQLEQQSAMCRSTAICAALQLMEAWARCSLAGRQALLEANCVRLLILRMTHLQEGLPLGAVERQSLPPAVEFMVREWTDPAMLVLNRLIQCPPPEDAGPEGEKKSTMLMRCTHKQLKEVVTSADLAGLLKWRVTPPEVAGSAQSGQKALAPPHALEQRVLVVTSSMVTEYPGYCKGLERDEEFMTFVGKIVVDGSMATTLDSNELQRRWFALHILKDILEHCGSTCITARLLCVGAPTAKSIVGAVLRGFVQTYHRCTAVEAILTSRIQRILGGISHVNVEEYLRGIDYESEYSAGLAHAAMELLEALLKQNPPELQLEAGRIKAYMEGLNLKQVVATRGPSDTHGRIKEAGQMALACIKRVDQLAALGQRKAEHEQQAAAAAAEAVAAALLAEEAAAQQASAAKAAKRQRQKAAKQAQQAAAAELQRREMEEREQRESEERERKAQEKAQKAAVAAAAALQAEREAAQQRAAAKAAKRQRKKAAKQAQQQAAWASLTSTADTSTSCIAASQPSGSAPASMPAPASLLPDALLFLQQASQQGPLAAAVPKSAWLPVHGGSQQEQQQQVLSQQGEQGEAGQAVAGLQGSCMGEVGTPEQAEARGPEASAEDDQEAEFQALLSILIPGAVEHSRPPSTPPPTWPSAGSLSTNNSSLLQQVQQQGSAPAPGLASVLRCALSGQQLRDPVIAADGWTYEREMITAWLAVGETCSAVTGQLLSSTVRRPNYVLRQLLSR